jgi:hypothetical protein
LLEHFDALKDLGPDGHDQESEMELGGYGLLIGKITGSRPQRRGNPHWLLVMQPGDPDHPSYRIAVNLQTTEKKKAPELQYQIIDFNRRSTKAGDALIKALTKLAPTRYFFPLSSMPDLPRLDFVRGGSGGEGPDEHQHRRYLQEGRLLA